MVYIGATATVIINVSISISIINVSISISLPAISRQNPLVKSIILAKLFQGHKLDTVHLESHPCQHGGYLNTIVTILLLKW